MSLSAIFSRGLDGLTVAQRGLSAASNNISNINTKGYAKQEIITAPRVTTPGAGYLGGGAEVVGIRSVVDSFVELQLLSTSNSFGTVDGRKRTVSQLESLWNESQDLGLGKSINEFFNSLSDLGNQPTSIPLRQAVRDRGLLLAQNFNRLSNQMNAMRSDLSTAINDRLSKVNQLAEEIVELNRAIVNQGGSTNAQDLAAQRTYVLRQLSEEIPISYYEQENGALNIQLQGGGNLVLGTTAGSLAVASDDLNVNGDIAIELTNPGGGTTFDVTSDLTTGRLGGLIVDRNTTLNTMMSNLDNLAHQMVTQFNAVYSTGYGLDSSTGNSFFIPLASASGAAAAMQVDASVTNDVRTIAAAQQDPLVSGVADNRNILALAQLQTDLTMSSGTATFSQYYHSLVGQVGNTANAVNKEYEVQSYLQNQMEIQRESVSGVNMDEEGANIIRYQRAFQAASRVIAIADQLMDDLLRI